MGTYDVHTYEGAYMLGVIAGKTTKTNKLGVVGSFPIPEVVRNINAYTLGARSVNPKVTTQVIWVNSWFDPGKERDAALALISQGSDTLMQNTDSPAVVQAAEQKGVHAFGWDSNMSKFGPKAQLAASVIHWETIYSKVLSDVVNKTWKPSRIWWGVSHGAIGLENFGPDVSPEVKKTALAVQDSIRTGKFHPFTGPIKDQNGKEILAKGKVFTDDFLSKMNFYVQGVEGVLPK
jgi:basic membrane protein A